MLQQFKNHVDVIIVYLILNTIVLINFIRKDQVLHGIGYFIFFFVSIFIIKFTTGKLQIKKDIRIKRPKQELFVTLLFTTIGFTALSINFYLRPDFQNLNFLIKLPILTGILFFSFPLALTIYLLIKRYKLAELGLQLKPPSIFIVGCLVWLFTGLCAWIFYPEGILWKYALKEFSPFQLLFDGLISAALTEEFIRFVLITRLIFFIKKTAYAILIASLVWSIFHFPVAYYKTDGNLIGTINYCIQIVPLGVVWGYLTFKTKSMLPSILVHGLNLWGFQNG